MSSRIPTRSPTPDRGASMLEYAAVLALIAGVVGVVFLATLSIAQAVSDGVGW